MSSHRYFKLLKLLVVLVACLGLASSATPSFAAVGWESVPNILSRIKAPAFPERSFSITEYGAQSGGADCTEAIQKAIQACAVAKGGRVTVPTGVFYTGAIHLRSNVNLHLSEGATLKFIPDPAKYLPVVLTRFEGIECRNYSPLIYAYGQENIAITGKGTLDGSASNENWWARARQARPDRNRLFEMGETGVPLAERLFGEGHFLRPNFIQPYRCKNVLIEGITIHNSPMWEVHPVLCTNVTVRGLNISSHGPNNDGCDPESCKDVLIENCLFDTGDDCIAIKSGRNTDGRRIGVASENLIIRNCTMKDGHGGVVIGSEISGNCRNVFVESCQMDSPNLNRALRFKSNAQRGGVLENVFLRNVTVGQVTEALLTIDLLYEEGANGSHRPIIRNVVLDNVTSNKSPRVMYIRSFPGAIVDGVYFRNCHFRGVEAADVVQNAGRIVLEGVTIESVGSVRSPKSPESPPNIVTPAAREGIIP